MKKKYMKILGLLFLTILINQIVMGVGTPENATNFQFNASTPIFSDKILIDISQNATGIGMHSAINFNIEIHNNGSTIARELNIALSTTTPEIQISPTSNFQISELLENTSLTLDVSADLSTSEITQAVDLVLIVDASGSMGEEIISVQEELTDLIDTLSVEIPDLRIGVIIYGSTIYSEYPMSSTNNYLDLTTEFENVKYFINSFRAGGGTEPWGDALYLAETFTWRNNAQKLIILVGDEDCDPGRIIGNGVSGSWYNGTELLSIVTQLKEIGVIINTVVCENPDNHVTHQFQWISEFTSGTSVFLPDLLNGETPITLPQIIQ
ncbi:MAG: vWA domain-containing protein, partial [Candidatus Kariarchaeaceae archaeon]